MKKTILALFVVSAFGCGDAEGDSAATTVSFALTAQNATDDGGTSHALTDVRFNVRHIELDLPAGLGCADVADQLEGARCENNDDATNHDATDDNPTAHGTGKIVVDGPFLVDLKAGTTSPSLDAVKIPDLGYARVDVRIDDDEVGHLDGRNSWLMTTQANVEGQAVAVDIALKFNEDIRFEAQGGVRTTGGPLMVSFDTTGWFEGLDVNACVDSGDIDVKDGVITISDDSDLGSCSSFEGTLKENLKRSGQLR